MEQKQKQRYRETQANIKEWVKYFIEKENYLREQRKNTRSGDWYNKNISSKELERCKQMVEEETQEEQQEEDIEEEEQEDLSAMYSEEAEIQKLPVGKFFSKEMFAGEGLTVTLYGLGKNQFGRPVIEIEVNGELGILNISSANQNQLVNFFGNKLKEWTGKQVKISAEYKEYDRLNPGYTLIFKKVV